jgi:hypothetical protein
MIAKLAGKILTPNSTPTGSESLWRVNASLSGCSSRSVNTSLAHLACNWRAISAPILRAPSVMKQLGNGLKVMPKRIARDYRSTPSSASTAVAAALLSVPAQPRMMVRLG